MADDEIQTHYSSLIALALHAHQSFRDKHGFCEECSHELHWIAWRGGYCCTNANCDATDIDLFNDELDELDD